MPSNSITFKTTALGDTITCYDGAGVVQFTITIDSSNGLTMLNSSDIRVAQLTPNGAFAAIFGAFQDSIYLGNGIVEGRKIIDAATHSVWTGSYSDTDVKVQTLGNQQGPIADAAGTLAQATTAINDLLSALRAHGLIAS